MRQLVQRLSLSTRHAVVPEALSASLEIDRADVPNAWDANKKRDAEELIRLKLTFIVERLEASRRCVAARDAGECVYVHCWGGIGRTGTVVGIELCRAGVATTEDFVEVIRRRRRFDKGGRSSPENAGQVMSGTVTGSTS